jgi:hypothetical protein
MPCAGFEPTIPASEQAKTVHASDRSATVTGVPIIYLHLFIGLYKDSVSKLVKSELVKDVA